MNFIGELKRRNVWKADGAVTAVSATCLLKRFQAPKLAGPSCRPHYTDFVVRQLVK